MAYKDPTTKMMRTLFRAIGLYWLLWVLFFAIPIGAVVGVIVYFLR